MFLFLLFLMLNETAMGYQQSLFKLFQNHDFQNNSGIFKTTKNSSLIKCSVSCAKDDECRAALFNTDEQTCSMSNKCETDMVAITSGSDVVQNCPVDCSELPSGFKSGIYKIYPIVEGVPYETEVFCDMDKGAWTVIKIC